jgi:hypothetical protein
MGGERRDHLPVSLGQLVPRRRLERDLSVRGASGQRQNGQDARQ